MSWRRLLLVLITAAFVLLGWTSALRAQGTSPAPSNLGGGLGKIVDWQRASGTLQLSAQTRAAATHDYVRQQHPRAKVDAAGRVIVDVILNGQAPAASVRQQLTALGADVFAEHAATGGSTSAFGRMSAWLPVEQAAAASAIPGVHSIALVHRPWHRVGVASQGVPDVKANLVQARGYTGKGITLGVLSDSFNLTAPNGDTAAVDVAAGNLPGPGNPNGNTTPVFVLNEGAENDGNEDEGRALLQIAYSVAPNARLVFSTSGDTTTSFSNNIEEMRTNSQANCDIMGDDIGFPDEPFFSDGIVAQAVEAVVTSSSANMAGHPVIFYSAAGNDGGMGYDADFQAVADATARNGGAGSNNLILSQVPDSLTAGGFHNFAAAAGQSGITIVQSVTVTGADAELDLQWDDPFIPGKITADYYMLVFDVNGNYLSAVSGTDDAMSMGEALQLVDLAPGGRRGGTYQIAITRGTVAAGAAQHFRYIVDTDGNITGTYLGTTVPTIFGHCGAADIDSVGAYAYNDLTAPESYSSLGPVTIYLDASGNLLATPVVRQQPTIAGVDGVDTSFFPPGPGNDTDGDGLPNFFGTSAAMPHAAGVAALIMQAAGGSGSLNAAAIRSLLERTATPQAGTTGYNTAAGYGLVNANTALNQLLSTSPPAFFQGQVSLGSGVYYLVFPNGNLFGYYNLNEFLDLYHYDLGFEFFIDADDGHGGAYLYDFTSKHFFYTSPVFAFPYLYDFSLQAFLYYFPDPNKPGHYTTNPRVFYNFATGQTFTQ